ncbi:hypothetical protein HNP86_001838 [Methanococcus maripaludis]|uniref:Uncharacterized protein n=1 Tax=Methanococcus maripaludis TaxID=39152 RepID=A0A7J9NVI0_METMI|nr:hypothetical protein [Methanococcus maripaludis]MBA2851679.1 hypothetical protein [Methanococcus maripaludis]
MLIRIAQRMLIKRVDLSGDCITWYNYLNGRPINKRTLRFRTVPSAKFYGRITHVNDYWITENGTEIIRNSRDIDERHYDNLDDLMYSVATRGVDNYRPGWFDVRPEECEALCKVWCENLNQYDTISGYTPTNSFYEIKCVYNPKLKTEDKYLILGAYMWVEDYYGFWGQLHDELQQTKGMSLKVLKHSPDPDRYYTLDGFRKLSPTTITRLYIQYHCGKPVNISNCSKSLLLEKLPELQDKYLKKNVQNKNLHYVGYTKGRYGVKLPIFDYFGDRYVRGERMRYMKETYTGMSKLAKYNSSYRFYSATADEGVKRLDETPEQSDPYIIFGIGDEDIAILFLDGTGDSNALDEHTRMYTMTHASALDYMSWYDEIYCAYKDYVEGAFMFTFEQAFVFNDIYRFIEGELKCTTQ